MGRGFRSWMQQEEKNSQKKLEVKLEADQTIIITVNVSLSKAFSMKY